MTTSFTFGLDPKELIYDRVDYNYVSNVDYSAIVYGVDNLFFMHAGISILSIIENTHEKKLHFIIITNSYNHTDFENIQHIISSSLHALSIIVISDTVFKLFPRSNIFPPSIYYRLVAPTLLREYNYLLYLDADIVALRSLADLFEKHKPDSAICAVIKEPEQQNFLSESIGITDGYYFNSGVMFIHTHNWIEQQVSENVFLNLIDNSDSFLYFDQDALNIVLNGKVKFIPAQYNQQIKAGHTRSDITMDAPVETVLLHYVGEDKPWQEWNQQKIASHYRHYRRNSPWQNIPYIAPCGAKQLKKFYKTLRHQGCYLQSVLVFFKFQYVRILEKRAFRSC